MHRAPETDFLEITRVNVAWILLRSPAAVADREATRRRDAAIALICSNARRTLRF